MSIPIPFPLDEEYKKKTLITPEDIRKLRQWVDTQPHLPGQYITDMDLILTYHCCNRSAEVSKQVLYKHYTLKTLFTNFFKNRIVNDKLLKTLSFYLFTPLQMRAHNESAVLYCRLVDYDVKNYPLADAIRCIMMVIDLTQYEQGTWLGLYMVLDLDKVTLGHIGKLDVQSVQQLLYFLQEAMLLKIKGLHFMNAPSFMDVLMRILRPFLKKELMDMLIIHQIGSKTIDNYIPIQALPKEAGGNFMAYEEGRDYWVEKMKHSKDFFLDENKKRVVESLRPGKPKTISDIFDCVEGSFKTLDID